MEITDWRGTPITVGTVVVYPRTIGRDTEMREGTVVDIWRTYRHGMDWVRLGDDQDPPNYLEPTPSIDVDGTPYTALRAVPHEVRVFMLVDHSGRGSGDMDRPTGQDTVTVIDHVTAIT